MINSLKAVTIVSLLVFIVLLVYFCFHKKQNQSESLMVSGKYAPLCVILFLSAAFFIYGMISLTFLAIGKGPLVNLEESPILCVNDSEEIYSLLVTILLSLLATVITAYVFMIGALQGRKEYERPAISRLQTEATKYLIILSIITSLCLGFIFIEQSKNFSIENLSWFRYTLVLISFVDIILLLIYTYEIINYEKKIADEARQMLGDCLKKMGPFTHSQAEQHQSRILNRLLKKIGDLEAVITQCVENYKASNRFQTEEIYSSVFEKIRGKDAGEIAEKYKNLILFKDLIQILKDHGANEDSFHLPVHMLKRELEEVCGCVTAWVMNAERFENLNFVDVNFAGGQFCHTSFRGAALIDVNLTGACLCSACFADTILRDVNFWDAACENADFTGALIEINKVRRGHSGTLTNAVFTNADLSGAKGLLNYQYGNQKFQMKNTMCKKTNFLGLDLVNVDFEGSILTNAQLTKTTIKNCSFKNADMECALLVGTVLSGKSEFHGANLSEVKAAESQFNGTPYSRIEFENARLARANFTSSKFQYCNFSGAYINDASFNDATFINCQLQGCIFNSTDLSGCVIRNCIFDYANLSQTLILASLGKKERGARICRTRFCNVDFSGAALRGYTFEECDFTKAVFDDAVLRDVTFKNCIFENNLFQKTLMVDVYWIDCQLNTTDMDLIIFGTKEDKERFGRVSDGM